MYYYLIAKSFEKHKNLIIKSWFNFNVKKIRVGGGYCMDYKFKLYNKSKYDFKTKFNKQSPRFNLYRAIKGIKQKG